MRAAGVIALFVTAAAYGCWSSAAPSGGDAGDGGDGGNAGALRVPELGPVAPLPAFDGDPITDAERTLGNDLFFDPRLSGSGHTACNVCHVPATSWQDNLQLSTPDRSYPADSPTLSLNTLSFLNLVYAPRFRWDGSQSDLVGGMVYPLAEPNMNVARLPAGSTTVDVEGAKQALYAKLTGDLPGYLPLYRDAFAADLMSLGADDVWTLTGRALRAFVAQAISRDAPFDRWNAGDDSAMSDAAVRGLAVFRGKGRCIGCHTGSLFTDFSLHNVSSSPSDHGAYLTPTLRGAYDTGPYFHDGSQPGLVAVLSFFAGSSVTQDPARDPAFATPLSLTAADMQDVIAFLRALRGAPGAVIAAPAALP
jgi:cytochrome c peroxidase